VLFGEPPEPLDCPIGIMVIGFARPHPSGIALFYACRDELDLSHQANDVACVDDTLAAALRTINEPSAASASNTVVQTSAIARTRDQPAHSTPDLRTSNVSLSDLDLAIQEGARVARECLHDEARRLCSQVADSFDLSHRPNFVGCVDETFAKALRQVAPPALVAGAAAASAQPASHP